VLAVTVMLTVLVLDRFVDAVVDRLADAVGARTGIGVAGVAAVEVLPSAKFQLCMPIEPPSRWTYR